MMTSSFRGYVGFFILVACLVTVGTAKNAKERIVKSLDRQLEE